MPDQTPPRLPGVPATPRGPISGAVTEPEQPLVVLGDNGTGMDDVMEIIVVGAEVENLGGNVARITIFPDLPGNGTFVLASVNNVLTWIDTTTC